MLNSVPSQGLRLELQTDPSVLRCTGIAAGAQLRPPLQLSSTIAADGRLRMLAFDPSVTRASLPAGADTVAVLTFEATADPSVFSGIVHVVLAQVAADDLTSDSVRSSDFTVPFDARLDVVTARLSLEPVPDGAVKLTWLLSQSLSGAILGLYRSLAADGASELIARDIPTGSGNGSYLDSSDEARAAAILRYELVLVGGGADSVLARSTLDRTLLLPSRTQLLPPAPSPFSHLTSVVFDLSQRTQASLDVYDIAGRRVATLARGEMAAGRHAVRWDGHDSAGRDAPPGVYLCTLRTPEYVKTLRLLRVK